jgi:hypothetical protein
MIGVTRPLIAVTFPGNDARSWVTTMISPAMVPHQTRRGTVSPARNPLISHAHWVTQLSKLIIDVTNTDLGVSN